MPEAEPEPGTSLGHILDSMLKVNISSDAAVAEESDVAAAKARSELEEL